ncbi:MAG: hypothetical protein WCY19_06020 [Candidatus Gastranaerophilaceae bacterium]
MTGGKKLEVRGEANTLAIRNISFQGLNIGGESEFLIKPVLALELNIFDFEASSHVVKDWYEREQETEKGEEKTTPPNLYPSPLALINIAQATDCDILALKFNLPEDGLDENIKRAKALLCELLPHIKKPLLVRGANNKSVDIKLLPALMEVLDREVIIAFADENTYKEIVPSVVKGGHILAIRTPIDINLAKEMNILTSDMGLSLDKILIDTDMGGLGYGLEYGYSIMERIKLAAFEGDKMLNMPLIAFAGEEALRAKETKSDTFSKSFGDFKERSIMYEITTASAVIAAGANLIVLEHPESVKVLKGLINE